VEQEKVPTSVAQPTSEPAPSEALLQVLADIGIENPKRSQMAGLDIDPLWVCAWHLWWPGIPTARV
jgi:hypothetical protein